MLDAFIIEEIMRREEKDERVQPHLESPGQGPFEPPPSTWQDSGPIDIGGDDTDNDGVIIIDMCST